MQVDPRLRFDNFVVGTGNRLAAAAARAVADSPGSVYTPLFIYSGSGLGKTHLMCAIGNQIARRMPGAVVEHVTLDDVLGQIHDAIAVGEIDAVRRSFQNATALLIDDMQFLAGHRETQSELLRVLNALQASGRQIVMTSDRPPGELGDVDERLLTRLSGGLIVDIVPPDYETRTAILRAKCEERGVTFLPGVIEELARLELSNVRELQGALNRLIAMQTLGGESVSPADVLRLLGDLADARALSERRDGGEFQSFVEDIASAVAERFDNFKPPLPGPSAVFTRIGYEVGASNQLAVRAADAVVERPGERYNPLFIHGPSGVGKTHLVNAIGNGLVSRDRTARVAVISASTFVDELIAALQEGSVERWRTTYRGADALILDDVQLIAEKERTQEELFHVFNALHSSGRQLVFASDKAPRDLEGLEDRLRSRFEGGLVVEIRSPDRELRATLHGRFLRAAGITPDPALLDYLAGLPASSVREIIGMVNRITATAELAGLPVTLDVVRAQLEPSRPGSATGAVSRPGGAKRASAALSFLDPEKCVWDWPDTGDRLLCDTYAIDGGG